jgi:hypothetical protein
MRVGQHLVVGAAAQHRARVVLGVPPLHRVLVALVEQHPRLAGLAGSPVAADQHQPAPELATVDLGVQLAGLDRRARVVGLHRLPGPDVPHHHVAAAVPARRDDALEVEVLDRVVLHVHREPARPRVEGRSLRDGPAHQHAVDLEAQVVVQPARPVPLHDEPRRPVPGRDLPGRLGGAAEVPHAAVGVERVGHAPSFPLSGPSCDPRIRTGAAGYGHDDTTDADETYDEEALWA